MSNKAHKRLVEEIKFGDVQFVETEGMPRVIKNVALLGGVARRGKDSYSYPVHVMENAVRAGKYDNCRCFINHPGDQDIKSGRRDLMNLAGIVKSPRVEEGKIKGDIQLLPDQFGDKFFNIAKMMPEAASCSHVADGKLKYEGGNAFVEEIKTVLSVDLVVQGATTLNVFESEEYQKGTEMDYADITIAEFKTKRPDLAKTLIEEGQQSRDDEVKKLVESSNALKILVDEQKVKEAQANRKIAVTKLLEESKLPKTAKTVLFVEQLVGLDDEGFDEKAKKLIEDRMSLVGGVKNMGGGGNGGNKDESGDFDSAYNSLTG